MDIYLTKQRWKIILLVVAIGIGFTSLFITNRLVKELSQEERKKIELWAEAIRQLSQISTLDDSCQNFSIIMEVLDNNTTVPVILTDEADNIIGFNNIHPKKIDTDIEKKRMLNKMKASKEPIEVVLLDDSKNFVYYKDSTTLTKLTYYPYIQLLIIILFILVSYYAFNQSRKSEQNQVWVGMAKETAHQLGTPTSSLLAWHEIIKDSNLSPELISEFGKDISRLEKIVDRFSKIGSRPSLKPVNLVQTINNSINYLKKRTSTKVTFIKNYDENESIIVPINETLFEWVVENITKNSIDAIQQSGEISFKITDNIQVVYIDITDNGKGIARSQYKTIFQPGFTTKSRGWGLGLTLSKRIVEEYHNGKIFVNYSEIEKGTSFRIVLRKSHFYS
ncbi:MAG TPA: HAMP domain-containing sensor histidine kinase [Tenuifilaceae bacterium]|nr:HAMP domain-containing sensor histidine kinase [Tenuifilaceae bacterium]HPE17112.1 HAMP domain-containing sensor histidine kinase [Tenuifilaceae bacterium]HPJ44838.1 HAMP domain-containing sensor histidine kinase [Tenuifilaceae bacterium]HPQ32868.1 HAMP domain-containing sensor histidine kinase [Tenuifilaceae bacterium]HRX67203.1 HAMP domain-containing sensor histidine kinase [Tenuifilaceae bacterium]